MYKLHDDESAMLLSMTDQERSIDMQVLSDLYDYNTLELKQLALNLLDLRFWKRECNSLNYSPALTLYIRDHYLADDPTCPSVEDDLSFNDDIESVAAMLWHARFNQARLNYPFGMLDTLLNFLIRNATRMPIFYEFSKAQYDTLPVSSGMIREISRTKYLRSIAPKTVSAWALNHWIPMHLRHYGVAGARKYYPEECGSATLEHHL